MDVSHLGEGFHDEAHWDGFQPGWKFEYSVAESQGILSRESTHIRRSCSLGTLSFLEYGYGIQPSPTTMAVSTASL